MYTKNASPYIHDNNITENTALWGGGVYIASGGRPLFYHNLISDNNATHEGGGLHIVGSTSPLVIENTIMDDSAGEKGGGIYCYFDASPTITGNTIRRNKAPQRGGGIMIWRLNNCAVSDNSIDHNYGGIGGGIYCEDDSYIKHNIITVNSSYLGGGIGLATSDAAPEIDSNTITYNAATGGGGGIYCGGYSHPLIEWNEIHQDSASSGSGIYCDTSFAKIRNNIISNNQGDHSGGTGIFCEHGTDTISFNNISNNISGNGIKCHDGHALIEHNTISGNGATGITTAGYSIASIRGNCVQSNLGTGIYCNGLSASLYGNIVSRNAGYSGGGLYGSGAIKANNNIFLGNSATNGGGMYISSGNDTLRNNVTYGNRATHGGGISCDSSNLFVTSTICWADTSTIGGEIDTNRSTPSIIFSDVEGGWAGRGNLNLDPLFKNPLQGDLHLMSIQCGDEHDSPCINMGDSAFIDSLLDCSWGLGNIYSDMGAYGGGIRQGGIINVPGDRETIQLAIQTSHVNDTVLVHPGIYHEHIIFGGKSVMVGSLFITTGDTSYISATVIDGGGTSTVVKFQSHEDSTSIIIGLTITGGNYYEGGGITCWLSSPSIIHNIVRNSTSRDGGGGIYCYYSSPKINFNIIRNNSQTGDWGAGGIYCEYSEARIANNVIYGNSTARFGGGISLIGSDAIITNNVISGNIALSGGALWNLADPVLVNNIIWGDTIPPDSSEIFNEYGHHPMITYCDIHGGWQGNGNVDFNPLFRNPAIGDYALMSAACGHPYDSPCIDMGDDAISDEVLDCSHGLGLARSDMGAFGGNSYDTPTDIDDGGNNNTPLPGRSSLSQNYPNPFNPTTTMRFSLPSQGSSNEEDKAGQSASGLAGGSFMSLKVYDVLGREVSTLVFQEMKPGRYERTFDGNGFSSGVYFARLQSGNFTAIRKMILVR